MRLSVVNASDLVRDAVTAHAVAGVDVEARVDSEPALIACDPVRLRQALDNLIRNAVIHGGARPVVVGVVRGDEGVSLSVADAGPGIAPEDLDRIFAPGVRLNEHRPGSGLGLSITRAIVEAHGGTLGVESSSAGSTFTITLPVTTAQPAT